MSPTPTPLERAAARSLVTKYLQVKPGENVIVETWPHTLSMASAFVDETRRAGGHALVHYEDEDAFFSAMERKQSKLLGRSSDPEWAALQKADVFVMFWGPEHMKRGDKFSDAAWEEATAWNQRWYQEARKAGLRGVRLELGHATEEKAREYGVSLARWRDDLLKASCVDPQELRASGERLLHPLQHGRRLRIVHSNGTDLELGLDHPKSRIFSGLPTKESRASPFGMMHNAPVGSLAVTLDGQTADGTIVGNRGTYAQWGTASGGRWTFEGGHLTSHKFAKGGATFEKRFATAKPGKDRPSFLYLGLNPALNATPNMEDCERGAVCVGVGANRFIGGENPSDLMAWITLAGSEISVDGRPVIRSGRIL
jgi:leucyl aminopeptidase (aminopeptidase T)